MSDSLGIDLIATSTAGRALASAANEAAAAGSGFLAAAGAVSGTIWAGTSIGSSVQAAGDAFAAACAEMTSSALGLGGLVQDAAAALGATEQAAIGRFGALTAI